MILVINNGSMFLESEHLEEMTVAKGTGYQLLPSKTFPDAAVPKLGTAQGSLPFVPFSGIVVTHGPLMCYWSMCF